MINGNGSNAVIYMLVAPPIFHSAPLTCSFGGADLGTTSKSKFSMALTRQYYPISLVSYCSGRNNRMGVGA